jgi:hypothetical protein
MRLYLTDRAIGRATELTSTGHDELRRCWIRDALVGDSIPTRPPAGARGWLRRRPPLPASRDAWRWEVQRPFAEILHHAAEGSS